MINAYTVAIGKSGAGSDDESKADAKDAGVTVVKLKTGEQKRLIAIPDHARRRDVLARYGMPSVRGLGWVVLFRGGF